jgi:hypothetical protein
MNKKITYAVSMAVAAITIASIFGLGTNSASAYESSQDYTHNHYTASYKGGPQICGLHICQPGRIPTNP